MMSCSAADQAPSGQRTPQFVDKLDQTLKRIGQLRGEYAGGGEHTQLDTLSQQASSDILSLTPVIV